MKKLLLALVCWVSTSLWASASIEGNWKTINEDTGQAQSVVAIYEYQGSYYGRLIGSFDSKGKMDDTIYKPKSKATGLPGQPFYMGMDFIWDLRPKGSDYKGKILDPEKGDVYKAVLWTENGNLKVKGKLFMFSRTQTWVPATKSDFPSGFKMPDTSKFVPVAPVDELY